ncbi:hypothetical protein Acr_00g0090870 [Actinidia rufa]|uniref:Uncharacterized protein n=1 Tax=Actinidia rufa TaxID=165716 RepID=A0A7J0DXN7_9ERIC|nr:hypothetical protein Acr_00g0090870 [Actinidia rufa]
MAAFGSSIATVCADYFGDELGLPLPPVNAKKTNTKNGVAAKLVEAPNSSTVSNDLLKKKNEKSHRYNNAALAFAPAIDGLHPFETLLFN